MPTSPHCRTNRPDELRRDERLLQKHTRNLARLDTVARHLGLPGRSSLRYVLFLDCGEPGAFLALGRPSRNTRLTWTSYLPGRLPVRQDRRTIDQMLLIHAVHTRADPTADPQTILELAETAAFALNVPWGPAVPSSSRLQAPELHPGLEGEALHEALRESDEAFRTRLKSVLVTIDKQLPGGDRISTLLDLGASTKGAAIAAVEQSDYPSKAFRTIRAGDGIARTDALAEAIFVHLAARYNASVKEIEYDAAGRVQYVRAMLSLAGG